MFRFAVLVTDRLADFVFVHFISRIAFAHVRFDALSVATLTNRLASVIIDWTVALVAVTNVIFGMKNVLHAVGIHAFRYADRHACVVLHFIGRTAFCFGASGDVILKTKSLIVRIRSESDFHSDKNGFLMYLREESYIFKHVRAFQKFY